MSVIIFFYVLGMILTALFIKSKKGLANNLEEKNGLTASILIWPFFLIVFFIYWCENLAKKGN